jgi:DNA modification methylase/ParB-like chromosome segregation protein Spo0J
MTNSINNNNHNDAVIVYLPITAIKENKQYSSLLFPIKGKEYEDLRQSISENGIKVPLFINNKNVLLDGYTRLRIAKELGLKEVPCTVLTFDNELEEQLFIIDINEQRRHLNTAQKAILADKRLEILSKLGKEKRLLNLKQFKANSSNKDNDNNKNKNNIASDTDSFPGKESVVYNDAWRTVTSTSKVSSKTLIKKRKIEKKAEEDQEIARLWQEAIDGERSLDSVYRRVIEKEARAKVRPIVEEGKVKIEDLTNVTILHGEFQEVLKSIPDNSIDLIFTDPPYAEKHLDLVKDLFLLASKVLKPSGFLAIMYGQNHLDEFFKVFESCNSNNKGNNTKLRYYWTIAIHMPDGQELFYMKNAVIRWKPIFIFQKLPAVILEHMFEDYISRPKPDKSVHEWKQDLESAMYVINTFSKEGDTILDPMVGTGTTIEASLMLKRRCIAVEKDRELYEMLLRRFSINKGNVIATTATSSNSSTTK